MLTPVRWIGCLQNPWKEINLPALQSADIPFVRRRSGGGTVYHVGHSFLSFPTLNQSLCDALSQLQISSSSLLPSHHFSHHLLSPLSTQDLGNTNYSALVPKSTFTRAQNASLVARALSSPPLLVPAEMNERNDITLEGKKISGSAYKLSGKRAYHHGTMLIEAELGVLGECLRSGRVRRSASSSFSIVAASPMIDFIGDGVLSVLTGC